MNKILNFSSGFVIGFLFILFLHYSFNGEFSLTFFIFDFVIGLIVGILTMFMFSEKKEEENVEMPKL